MDLKKYIQIEDQKTLLNICGVNDKNIRKLEKISACKIYTYGNEIHVDGENHILVERTIEILIAISKNDGNIYSNMIELLYNELKNNINLDVSELLSTNINIPKVYS